MIESHPNSAGSGPQVKPTPAAATAQLKKCPKCWKKVKDIDAHIQASHPSWANPNAVWLHPKAQLHFNFYNERPWLVDSINLNSHRVRPKKLWSLDFQGEFEINNDWSGFLQVILNEKQLRILKKLVEKALEAKEASSS